MFALIEHPRAGLSLFDTGYSLRFFEATAHLPFSLYARAAPVTLPEAGEATARLSHRGIRPVDIERVFISHFHADHVAALADFPRARYLHWPGAYAAVRGRRGLGALRRAYIPSLIPPDFEERADALDPARIRPLPPELAPFGYGLDIFGDESVLAVALPGHAAGQMGLIVEEAGGQTTFLVADACWLREAYQENRSPHPLASLIFDDPRVYRHTLADLHRLHRSQPDVRIIPSHCALTLAAVGAIAPDEIV